MGRKKVAVIHRTPQLERCLHKLHKAGGRAGLAATRVEAILMHLARQDGVPPAPLPKLTHFGERRIKGCKKFNLGGGYRLVYVQEEQHYLFLFAGTHDDCDRWLTNNRHVKTDVPAADTLPAAPPTPPVPSVSPAQESADDEVDYDNILMHNIDEKMLRRIFHGLFGQG